MSTLKQAFAEIQEVLVLGGHIRELSITWSDDGPNRSFTFMISDDVELEDADGQPIPDTITVIGYAEASSIPDGFIGLAAALNDAAEAVSV